MATKDFFVSYSSADRLWAEWIAWQLEDAHYSVTLQTWQFQPGQDFVQDMQDAIEQCQHTLVVLSPDYLNELEMHSDLALTFAFVKEPAGGTLVPVQVRESQDRLKGILSMLISIDLVGRDEAEAREVLLTEIKRVSAKSSPRAADSLRSGNSPRVKHTSVEQPEFPVNFPRIWNMPPHNRFFTDRETVLHDLHSAFTVKGGRVRTLSQALSGLGGIGKTQVAIEYAYRYRDEYQAVLWLPAESQEALLQSCHAIVTLLDLPEKEAQEHDELVGAVRTWLQEHVDWLLILDNADDLSIVRDFLPSATRGHVLITTRAQAVGRVAKGTVIEQLTPEEGGLFLLRRAGLLGPEEQLDLDDALCHAAMDIARMVDGLPLALDQAGSFIEEVKCSLEEYLSLYQKSRKQMLGRRGNPIFDHPLPVATTWSLSFEHVQRDNPVAADMLRLCAFLAADDIPEELLTQDVFQEGTALHTLAQNPLALHEAIAELRRYSLVRRQLEDKTLSIHRLVQAVLRDTLPEEERHRWATQAVLAVNAVFPEVKFETWAQCQRYLPHARASAAAIEQWHLVFPEAAHLLRRVAQYLQARVQYATAARMFQQAATIYDQAADKKALAKTLTDLADLLVAQGKYAEAEDYYRSAVATIESAQDTKYSDITSILDRLLDLYFTQGRYTHALAVARRALELSEEALKPDNSDIATSLTNLGRAYRELGEPKMAEPLAQRALAIAEQALGPEHLGTSSSLNNLAILYQDQGRYAEAEPLFKRALTIAEQALGPEHPTTAINFNNLALLYQAQGRYSEAEPLYQQALAIDEKVLGPEHPGTATDLNNLASLYQDQKRYSEAEPIYQRALAIDEQVLGLEHPDTATDLTNLASLYQDQERYSEAEPLYKRALAIREQALGPEHPNTADSFNNLASLYQDQGRYAEAEPLFKRVLVIREQVLGFTHPDTIGTRRRLSNVLRQMQRNEEAEALEALDQEDESAEVNGNDEEVEE
jgi:tetratricopeptide (TPR) repeat protein